jgi:hypothetical protein
MSTNRITSFSGLWSPTEYRNIEAGKVTIGTIQAGWPSARWSEDTFYYLDPYSGGGSGTIYVFKTGYDAGGSVESLQYSIQRTSQPSRQLTVLL